jgi:hypothetical protein
MKLCNAAANSSSSIAAKHFVICRIFAVSMAAILAGCAIVQPISPLGKEAKTRLGQLLYVTPKRSVIGDIVIRNLPGGDYDIEFSKGGIPVMQLQMRGSRMTATGLFARPGWTGDVHHAPVPLRPWASLKEIIPYFDSKETHAQRPGEWDATFQRTGNTLSKAKIQFPRRQSMTISLGP